MQRSDWEGKDGWKESEWKQLDEMNMDNMYGPPVFPPKGATILQTIWTYLEKPDKKKSRNCCNGKQLKRQKRGIQRSPLPYYQSYAACASQVEMRVFITICAHKNYLFGDGDAINAYAQSPPPEEPTYVRIDDQYADWYYAKHGHHVDRRKVLPVQHALQGHPESGALWAKHIAAVLSDLGFTAMTHAPCIYKGTWKDKEVLICKQVDDFQIASHDRGTIEEVIEQIGGRVRFVGNKELMTKFNGACYIQSRDYIKMHCQSYIEKILSNHGWDTPMKDEGKLIEPLHPDGFKELERSVGPTTDT